MVDRLDEIEERAKSLPFRRKPWRYVQYELIELWWNELATVNTLQDLVTEDIPYLLARVRELEAAIE